MAVLSRLGQKQCAHVLRCASRYSKLESESSLEKKKVGDGQAALSECPVRDKGERVRARDQVPPTL